MKLRTLFAIKILIKDAIVQQLVDPLSAEWEIWVHPAWAGVWLGELLDELI